MDEREACALLKRRFEAAGFTIEENRPLEVDGLSFEIDGFDADDRVGYEYVTSESGDGWDVDEKVVAALAAHRKRGELQVLVVDEADARDAATLGKLADEFLAALAPRAAKGKKPAAPAKKKPAEPAKKTAKPAKGKTAKPKR